MSKLRSKKKTASNTTPFIRTQKSGRFLPLAQRKVITGTAFAVSVQKPRIFERSVVVLLTLSFFLQGAFFVSADASLPAASEETLIVEVASRSADVVDIYAEEEGVENVETPILIVSPIVESEDAEDRPREESDLPILIPNPEDVVEEVLPGTGVENPEGGLILPLPLLKETVLEEEVLSFGETALVNVTHSDSEVVFNKDLCTELASGSFYCQKTIDTQSLNDDLFASPDAEGDLEIYLIRNGEQFQVTDNKVDDAAPYYDQNSNTLVWHRLIDERYQIVSYDIDAGTEEQLTFTSTNNMEPTRQGKYIVWQRWVGSNWDIVLRTGDIEEVISDSSAHDIAPYIHGSLVVWNRYNQKDEKTIEMYDIENETYVTIDDPEGLSVTNPRMVFVYDSLHPNGDIVTKGYDVLARKFIDLSTLPRPLPEGIPHSDSTGETRALIQSKPIIKSEFENSPLEPEIVGGPDPLPPEQGNASSSDFTLDLKDQGTSTPAVQPIEELTPIDEYDLIITPLPIESETKKSVHE